MKFHVRILGSEDAGAFRALRLEALARHPCAFAATHDEESGQSAADVAARLACQAVFGAFVDGALVGVAGFATPALAKKMHKGLLWGVYVGERRRGHGLGRALVARVIEHARDRVAQLHAAVVTGNAVAGGLYRDLGFVTYGIEPRALKVGERYFDQELMVLMLDEASCHAGSRNPLLDGMADPAGGPSFPRTDAKGRAIGTTDVWRPKIG
ncbi:MAG: GNAT family N-acetyltransferase [Geminicoccaceae bacterium]